MSKWLVDVRIVLSSVCSGIALISKGGMQLCFCCTLGRSSRPAPRPAAARSPPPQTVNHAPPPAPVQASSGGSLLGGIGSTIAQGMAFGTGSAVAHRAVDSVMGPRTIQHEQVVSEAAAAAAPSPASNMDACNIHSKAFQDCLNGYGNDISKCQFYMDMLSECRKNSGGILSA